MIQGNSSKSSSNERIRELLHQLYRVPHGMKLHQLPNVHRDEMREHWNLDEGYMMVEVMRLQGSPGAAIVQRILDLAKAEGYTSYRRAMMDFAHTEEKPEKTSPAILNELAWRGMGVPLDLAKRDMLEFNYKREPDTMAYSAVAKWANAIIKGMDVPGSLVLTSKTNGNGKSTLATLTFKKLVEAKMQQGGVSALWISAPSMFNELRKESLHDPSARFGIEKLIAADVLLIDDLGKEKPSDKTLEYMFQIIDSRYKTKHTIITSNLQVSEMARSIGTAGVSRLYEGFLKVVLRGGDYRKAQALSA